MDRDVKIFFLFSFFMGFYLANGTTVLFARVLEFSFSQIFLLGAFYMLMFVIFEIPSGALADLLGRKKTVALGCVILAIAALATGSSSTFTQVFLSFFVWALGFSLISGANEALLYDRLSDPKNYAKILGRSHFYFLIGTAAAGIAGPFLYSVNFRFAYLFSAIPFILAGVVIMFFHEEVEGAKYQMLKHWQQVISGVKIAFQNRFVFWAIGVMSLAFGVAYTFSNSYQPYLQDINFSIQAFSFILPIMFVSEALGGSLSGKFMEKFGENRIFSSVLVLIGVSIALLGLYPSKSLLAVLLFYTFLQGVLRPVISTYSNRHIEKSQRATVISVQSMVATVTAALMLFMFGFFTDRIGLLNLLIVLGCLVIVASVVLLVFRPKNRVT